MAAATRCVVVAPNWVGDTVMALPVIDALTASGREVHVLCRAHLEPLLRMSSSVSAVIRRESDVRTIECLRRAGAGEAFVLPNSFRSAWLPYRAHLPQRYGYRGNFRGWMLSPAVRRPPTTGHQVDDYHQLLAAAGVSGPEEWRPRIEVSSEVVRAGREALERAAALGSSRLIGIFPGAEFGPSKRWPWQRFAELTHALRRTVEGVQLVLLAGPKEVWSTVRIHEQSGRLVPVVGSDLDLADLAGLLHHLDLLVTNDSGPMHMAAALDVPCVAIFGPTDPRRTRPYGDDHEVLYTDRWCSPCFRKRCPLLHQRCMTEIEVDQVAAAVGRLVSGQASG